jgi:serine/threonine protein kinase
MAELTIGQTIGSYFIVDVLGRGGMATVYKARQTSPDRFVALKILSPVLAHDPDFVTRFRHEANIAASVDHPNVVPIYAVGETNDYFFIAMRLVPGQTLTETIRHDGRLSLERACRILRQIADALDDAHRRGVIHRDLKPGNVLIEADDRVTLTDFGIARARDETLVGQTQGIIGTPHYMAPEQALGKTIDYRADLYALGVVAYEMLTGRVPFEAATPVAVLHRQIYDATPSIREVRTDLPVALDTAIGRMLAKSPGDRFPSASAFVTALADVIPATTPGLVIADTPTVRVEPTHDIRDAGGSTNRHRLGPVPLRAAVVAIFFVAVLAIAGLRLTGGGGVGTSSPSPTPVSAAFPAASVTAAPTDTSDLTPVVDTPSPLPALPVVLSPTGGPGNTPSPKAATPTTMPSLPGGTIVFTSDNPADRSLYAISPSGQNLRQLTSVGTHNPACSPNGDAVAFESNRTGVSLIYRIVLASSGTPVAITAGSGSDQLATWNPNGKSIAFARARPGNTAIFTINLGDHHERQLTSGEGGDWRMSYSPDGGQIVFTSTRGGQNDLWLINVDGTNVRQLTSGPGDKRDPAWSPDGKWIAFRSDRDGHHWDLYRVAPVDGRIIRLTSDSTDKGFPNWSPDSHWILFAANRGGTPRVYVISVDGGDWVPITSPTTIAGGATWCR